MEIEKIAEEITPTNQEPEPVFVVGMNGSGTSMIADSLGRHPELFITRRETRLIPHLALSMREIGDLSVDENFLELWERVRAIPAFRILNGRQTPPLLGNWRDFPRSLPAVLDGVFRYLAAREGKTRWGEKTPQHVQHMGMLQGLFPKAKFVHVIRDGRDCAASFHRRFQRTPELTMYRWKNVVNEGRSQRTLLGKQYLEIRYEDVTADPALWMGRVCAFAGLPFDERVLKSEQPGKENRTVDGRIEPNSGKWLGYFAEPEIRRLEAIGGDCLEELGYPVQTQAGATDPGRFMLYKWRVNDSIRQFSKQLRSGQFRGWWRRDKKFAMRKMLDKAAAAIKQIRANRY